MNKIKPKDFVRIDRQCRKKKSLENSIGKKAKKCNFAHGMEIRIFNPNGT
jgi:hypothetical protein